MQPETPTPEAPVTPAPTAETTVTQQPAGVSANLVQEIGKVDPQTAMDLTALGAKTSTETVTPSAQATPTGFFGKLKQIFS